MTIHRNDPQAVEWLIKRFDKNGRYGGGGVRVAPMFTVKRDNEYNRTDSPECKCALCDDEIVYAEQRYSSGHMTPYQEHGWLAHAWYRGRDKAECACGWTPPPRMG